MEFTKIRLNGLSAIDFPIIGALPSDKFILKSANGLGPPEIDVSISNTLNAGGIYQGRRPQSREIVLLIGLNPDFAVGQTSSDLRSELYGMLTTGNTDHISLDVMNGNTVLMSTIGYSKKLEIVPFSQVPEVQLTIACVEQYFYAPQTLYLDITDPSQLVIDNVGSAPAGFYMEITFTASVSSWALWDSQNNIMEVVYSFIANDTLTIDTRPGYRGIWLTRDSTKTNIIHALSWESIWFMLHGGLNEFITSYSNFTWGDVFYLPQYWGI